MTDNDLNTSDSQDVENSRKNEEALRNSFSRSETDDKPEDNISDTEEMNDDSTETTDGTALENEDSSAETTDGTALENEDDSAETTDGTALENEDSSAETMDGTALENEDSSAETMDGAALENDNLTSGSMPMPREDAGSSETSDVSEASASKEERVFPETAPEDEDIEGNKADSTAAASGTAASSILLNNQNEIQPETYAVYADCVHKSYGSRQVLIGATIHVRRGDIYALVGRDGSGRSTLLKMLLGLTEFSAGNIYIDGTCHEAEIRTRRSHIGFLLGVHFFPELNARKNLNYYRRLKGVKGGHREVTRVLRAVGLDNADRKCTFAHYSEGMKRRLGIANALLGNPEILILDEPFIGMDPQEKKLIREYLKKLNKENGTTIILASNDLSSLELTANRFGILSGGKIISEFTKTELTDTWHISGLTVRPSDLEKACRTLSREGIQAEKICEAGGALEDIFYQAAGGSRQ